jgi:hypothetical protein
MAVLMAPIGIQRGRLEIGEDGAPAAATKKPAAATKKKESR